MKVSKNNSNEIHLCNNIMDREVSNISKDMVKKLAKSSKDIIVARLISCYNPNESVSADGVKAKMIEANKNKKIKRLIKQSVMLTTKLTFLLRN